MWERLLCFWGFLPLNLFPFLNLVDMARSFSPTLPLEDQNLHWSLFSSSRHSFQNPSKEEGSPIPQTKDMKVAHESGSSPMAASTKSSSSIWVPIEKIYSLSREIREKNEAMDSFFSILIIWSCFFNDLFWERGFCIIKVRECIHALFCSR